MVSTITELSCNIFTGIKTSDASFSSEVISCSDCQNIELYDTNQNQGTGIRVSKGNKPLITELKFSDDDNNISNREIISMFSCQLGGLPYLFLYIEDDIINRGYIATYDDITKTLTKICELSKATGKCSFTFFEQGYLEFVVVSNNDEMKYLFVDTEKDKTTIHVLNVENVDTTQPTYDTYSIVDEDGNTIYIPFADKTFKDELGREVCGLGLVNFDSRLWVYNRNVLWYSAQAECRRFDFNDTSYVTSAGYIEFGKEITAIHVYNGQLAVFFNDGYKLVTTDTTTGFGVGTENFGGCSGYNSLVFHGTDLYVYDNNKKGIYSLAQTATGDTAITTNLASDVINELNKISSTDVIKGRLRTQSVVTNDRNEIWFLINSDDTYSEIIIFDYVRQAWVKRKSNRINCMCVHNNVLYSACKGLYVEYTSELFGDNRKFIPAYYICSTFNMGSDNTLKITKFPPRLTVEASSSCNFNVQYIKNYNKALPTKDKYIKAKTLGNTAYYLEEVEDEFGDTKYFDVNSGKTYSLEDCPYRYYDENDDIDTLDYEIFSYAFNANSIVKLPSITFKALEMKFYTKEKGENFDFKSLEITKIKVKQV